MDRIRGEMTSELHIRVRERLPITVASVRGTLETATLAETESALRECLALMPSALIIEGQELTIAPSAQLWLLGLARSASRWPGTAIILTGEHPDVPDDPCLGRCPSLEAALSALRSKPFPERRQLVLPPDPGSCARARALVAQACVDWGVQRPRRLAELLVSELVANAVMHAGTRLKVTVRRTGSELELSVRDHGVGRLPAESDLHDPRGFGLQLLAALSDSWGWSSAGTGKVVWSRLKG